MSKVIFLDFKNKTRANSEVGFTPQVELISKRIEQINDALSGMSTDSDPMDVIELETELNHLQKQMRKCGDQ